MFAANTPAVDAVAVRRVRDAGAIMIGKTRTHEFAWGVTSVNKRMGTSRNPWSHEHVSGGSSGGSAVALASRLVPLAIGSDTGGSIRVPSAVLRHGRVQADIWAGQHGGRVAAGALARPCGADGEDARRCRAPVRRDG